MVAGAFPLVKLGSLVIKQASKPVANAMKRRAKSSPFFKKYVCMPPAQIYHWFEVNFRLNLMGLGRAKHVDKLSDEMATELGAEMLGEFIIFSIAVGTLMYEYNRSATKEEIKEERERQKLLSLEKKIQDLGLETEKQGTQIRELERTVSDLNTRNLSLTARIFGTGKT
ncbi:putative OPA3-like protein CG13603 [Haliotis rubra]|uniref:putative OPA3-like protein CG13603 n=1 Tax=Haliotis rubra TaxID=36100 RepID=UPI001EE5F289|nr:putative OPA3-like protein CG13603 [Haliotis rubra]